MESEISIIQAVAIHPGYIGHDIWGVPRWGDAQIIHARENRKIELFMPFANFEEMAIDVQDSFLGVIKRLFDLTKQEWEPKNCHECALRMLKKIVEDPQILPHGWIAAAAYIDNHSWLEIYTDSVEINPIIVDPTGLPKDMYTKGPYAENYIPYFGYRQFSPQHLKPDYESQRFIQRIFSDNPQKAMQCQYDKPTGTYKITTILRENSEAHHTDLKIEREDSGASFY